MNIRTVAAITTIIVVAIVSRVVPHPPNFTPITAIALLGAAYYTNKWISIALPLIIMFISDLIIGLHHTIPFVYSAFILISLLGFTLRKNFNWKKLILVTLLSSILFFLITNFGVWLIYDTYPKNFIGLIECYTAAIPFFRNSILGDIVYTSLLFGAAELMKKFNIISQHQHA